MPAMGTIETTYDLSRDLTVIKAAGKMEADDFRQWTEAYYSGTVTSLHLWDISDADVSQFTFENIEDDAINTKRAAAKRKNGKTAFVTPKDLDFGIGRMCETLSEYIIGTIEYRTFRTLDEAREWLGIGVEVP